MCWTFPLLLLLASVAGTAMGGPVELREGEVQIALRAEVAVTDAQVRLGDVAVLHTRDLQTMRRLVSLPLGRAQAVGSEGVLRRASIARWIRSQLGIGEEQVQWSGSEETYVRLQAQELSGPSVQRAAEAALREWLTHRTSRFEVQVLPVMADLKLPAGSVALQVRPFPDNAQPSRRMLAWVDVHVDGRFVRATPVSFRVDAFAHAWVAPKGIAKGAALAPTMVERREVEMTGRPPSDALRLVRSGGDLSVAAWRATRRVAEGEPISMRNAARAPLVARGEWVLLRLVSGQVELERRAEVMQDGDLGQVVQVRSSGSSGSIRARVLASGRVEAML